MFDDDDIVAASQPTSDHRPPSSHRRSKDSYDAVETARGACHESDSTFDSYQFENDIVPESPPHHYKSEDRLRPTTSYHTESKRRKSSILFPDTDDQSHISATYPVSTPSIFSYSRTVTKEVSLQTDVCLPPPINRPKIISLIQSKPDRLCSFIDWKPMLKLIESFPNIYSLLQQLGDFENGLLNRDQLTFLMDQYREDIQVVIHTFDIMREDVRYRNMIKSWLQECICGSDACEEEGASLLSYMFQFWNDIQAHESLDTQTLLFYTSLFSFLIPVLDTYTEGQSNGSTDSNLHQLPSCNCMNLLSNSFGDFAATIGHLLEFQEQSEDNQIQRNLANLIVDFIAVVNQIQPTQSFNRLRGKFLLFITRSAQRWPHLQDMQILLHKPNA